jgi:hypothetical protein
MPKTYTPASARMYLIGDVSERLFKNTESWEFGKLGADIAYLLWAIAQDGQVEWLPSDTLTLFLRLFKPDHAVWRHITLLEEQKSDGRAVNSRETK